MPRTSSCDHTYLQGRLGNVIPLLGELCPAENQEFYKMATGEELEWVAYPFSRGSSQPRNQTGVSCIAGSSLPGEPQGKTAGKE